MAYALAIQALGEPTRRSIFERLRRGPRAVGELARELPVSRPAVSQHLRVLKEAGLVTEQRNGTRRIWRRRTERRRAPRLFRRVLVGRARELHAGGRAGRREEEMSTTETTEAVRKSVLVDADPETAFRVFTDRIQTWWPLDKHGIFGEEAEGLAFRDDQIVESAK